jgi:hypothetical protein
MSNRSLGDRDWATSGEPLDGAELTNQISAISILNEPLRRADVRLEDLLGTPSTEEEEPWKT